MTSVGIRHMCVQYRSLTVMPNSWQVLVGPALATLLPAVGETGNKAEDNARDKASRSYRKQYTGTHTRDEPTIPSFSYSINICHNCIILYFLCRQYCSCHLAITKAPIHTLYPPPPPSPPPTFSIKAAWFKDSLLPEAELNQVT